MKDLLRGLLLVLPLGIVAWAGCGGSAPKAEPPKGQGPVPTVDAPLAPPDVNPGTPPTGPGTGTPGTAPGTGS